MVFYTRRAKVTTWYTAPTAIRRLTYGGHKARSTISKSKIDFKCGEPLNAEAVIWGEENFDLIMDNWWQTETEVL
jgi:acyl-coenzyme A synthetase/AMP-(fatty) acid ligase